MIITLLILANVNVSSYLKFVSLNNQQFIIQPTFTNLHPNEYTQGLCYYPFVVNLDKCVGSCSTLNDLSNKLYVANKKEDLNLRFFNIIIGINELKMLAKHTLFKCKFKFDGTKCNSNQKWNNNTININESIKI